MFRIEDWIGRALIALAEDGVETDHLDVLGFPEGEYWSLPILGQCFRAAVQIVGRDGRRLQVQLALPLEPVARLDMLTRYQGADVETLLAQARREEPPSLYLMGPAYWARLEDVEEYKCPVRWQIEGLSADDYVAYLHAFRRGEMIEQGWEYGVAVCLDHVTRPRS